MLLSSAIIPLSPTDGSPNTGEQYKKIIDDRCTATVINYLIGVPYFNASYSFSHSLHSASIDGNTRFAPASERTLSFNGPVLAAMVKCPAATPAVTTRWDWLILSNFPYRAGTHKYS